MVLKNIAIEERESKNGKKYYVLIAITDEKENNKKFIGFVNKNSITTGKKA